MYRIIFLVIILSLGMMGHTIACDKPMLFKADSLSSTSADVSWYSTSPAILSFEIDIKEGNAPPSSIALYKDIQETDFQINGLLPGKSYSVYLRSVCTDKKSDWITLKLRTAFKALNDCQLNFPIADDNCRFQGRELLKIQVDSADINEYENPVLSSISLIIEHSWPPDLTAKLISPSGQEIQLFEHLALGHPNLGNPKDSLCVESLIFRDNSCELIQEASGPFIGEFKPIDLLGNIAPEDLIGYWYLDICDASLGDEGTVKSMNLTFGSGDCTPIYHQPQSIDDQSVKFHLLNANIGDTIIYRYGQSPFNPGDLNGLSDTFHIQSHDDSLAYIDNLEKGVNYTFYALRKCMNESSSYTCAIDVATLCDKPTQITDFNEALYSPTTNCTEKKLTTGVWYQDEHSLYGWKINRGSTATDFTGPESSPLNNDQYIYFDASDYSCGNHPAIMKSSCFFIPEDIGDCSMSFDYSMNGNEISTLLLRIMANESGQWDTLFIQSGHQSEDWLNALIDLRQYAGNAVNLEFIAGPSIGARGDIALDNIIMMGPELIHRDGYLLYVDNDGDGYGITEDSTRFCRQGIIEGYADLPGDCDDNNPAVNPGVEELPCNLIDDNCNGLIDEVPGDTPPLFTIKEKLSPSCKGIADGVLEIDVENYDDYNIVWNTGDTTTRLEHLPAGVYYADFSTPNGCLFRTEFYELKNNSNISALITSSSSPTCDGIADGHITVQAGGGNAPYSYSWDTGRSASTIDSLEEGFYSVTVTDATGCIVQIDSIQLSHQYSGKAQIDVNRNITCNNSSNGSLIASLQGAQPQTFQWNTGGETRTISGLGEGVYVCTMTFLDNCTITTDSFYLQAPDSLYLKRLNIVSPSCASQDNGSLITSVGGGTQPYRYRLRASDTIYSGPVFMNLPAGEFTLEIRDQNNCTLIDTIELKGRIPFEMDATVKDTRCPLSSDGSIITDFSGGTEPYSYVWSSTGLGTSSIHNLSHGQYSLTVVDDFGCKSEKYTYRIIQGEDKLQMGISIIEPIYCGDSLGTIEASILNLYDSPLEYNWNNGTVHKHSSGLDTLGPIKSGNYRTTVTDANGCVGSTDLITLKELSSLEIDSILIQDALCAGDANGSIEIFIHNYKPPLNFLWTDGNQDSLRTQLLPGVYQTTITDAASCEFISPLLLISTESQLSTEHQHTEVEENVFNVEVIPSGGKEPYSILWHDHQSSDFKRTGLSPGEYAYTIYDDNECQLDSSIFISKVGVADLEVSSFYIFPNPATDVIKISHKKLLGKADFTITLYSVTGEIIKIWRNEDTLDISSVEPGVYYVELDLISNKFIRKLIIF